MASPISTGSYYSRETNDSSRAYAKAANDASYKYYNNMTWSMWVQAPPSVNRNIFSMWEDVASNNRSWLFSTQANGTFRTIFSWDGTGFSLHTTSFAIFDNSWKHIIVSFASGVQTVYVNNVLQTQTTTIAWGGGAAGLFAAGQQLLINSKNPATPPIDNSIAGGMNNFSMWNKVLSSTERTELYNLGRPGDLTTHSAYANCTNWWRMDQSDSVSTFTDSKNGSGSNMTITASGTSGIFAASANYQKLEDYPSVGSVISGVSYNGASQTGTFTAPTAAAIADAVWDELTSGHTGAGSFGELEQKQLTTTKFIGLK
jgi:hypothetical protein